MSFGYMWKNTERSLLLKLLSNSDYTTLRICQVIIQHAIFHALNKSLLQMEKSHDPSRKPIYSPQM